jgi:UrcA family protein
MSRLNSALVLRRTSERLTAGAAAIAATFLMLATVEVRAAEAEATTARISVTYNDTAFATQAETAAVYRKLKAAAREVCGVETGTHVTLDERARGHACVNEALTDVVRRLNRPMLTSVHEASAGKVG